MVYSSYPPVNDDVYEEIETIEIEASVSGPAEFSSGRTLLLNIVSDDPNPVPDLIFADSLEPTDSLPE